MGIYQSSGRTRNPLGAISVMVGMVGAARRDPVGVPVRPDGALVRSVASSSVRDWSGRRAGPVRRGLRHHRGGLGVALSVGGNAGVSVVAIVLGVIALSYPVLQWFKVVTRPLLRNGLLRTVAHSWAGHPV